MPIKIPTKLTTIVRRIKARNNAYAVETGSDLLQAKAILKHGEFGPWLKTNFGWSASTAQNYMNAAKLAEKNPTVANLKPSAVMALAAPNTPANVKAEVLADLDAGLLPSPSQIKAKIAASKTTPSTSSEAEQIVAKVTAKIKADAITEFDLTEHLRKVGLTTALEAIAAAFPHIGFTAEQVSEPMQEAA